MVSLTGASSAARKQRQAIQEAKMLQDAAFSESEGELDPWRQYERDAARNLSYQVDVPFEESYYMTSLRDMPKNPLYQALQQAGMDATQVGLAGAGALYGGEATEAYSDVGRNAFMQAYGANTSNYNNYLNSLQQMASPQVTMGLANMRMGNAANQGQLGMQQADTYMSQANARQALISDVIGGAVAMGSAAMGNPMPLIQKSIQQPGAATPQLNMRGTLPQQNNQYMLPQKPSIYNF